MDMSGSQRIEANKERVFAALNDPDILKQCVPGCQSIEQISDTELKAIAIMKIGPMKVSFSGTIQLSDLDPPNGYTISGNGNGGIAGNARGSARVNLEQEGDITLLTYVVEAQIAGKIAQLGSRLIDATAKKLAADFFERFSVVLNQPIPHT